MPTKKSPRIAVARVALLLLTLGSTAAAQTTITVGQGGGYDHSTIQAGIDAAATGDTVLVFPGTYVENVKFNRRIILRSTDPTDTGTVAKTIISGNWKGPVVEFTGNEPPTTVLAGFTIRNGYNPEGGGGVQSPKSPEHPYLATQATIEHNTIEFNRGWRQNSGGGIYGCDGTIRNNVIIYNDTWFGGGGLSDCDGFIAGNTIAYNRANSGGGLHGCDGVIRGNFISENEAYNEGGGAADCNGWIENNSFISNLADYGGGLRASKGLVQGNTFLRNTALWGGGVSRCQAQNNLILGNVASYGGGLFDATAFNNTIVGNHAKREGGGLHSCRRIRNCVIWENTSELTGTEQLSECTSPAYSCVQDWTGGGSANIIDDPLFEDPDGADNDPATFEDNVYRLMQGSPCIDSGKNVFMVADPVGEDIQWWLAYLNVAPFLSADLDGNCRLAGDYFDMGCYEFGSTRDADGDLLSNISEGQLGTDPEQVDTDEDGLADGVEVLRKSNPTERTQPGILSIPADFRFPEEALMAVLPRDEVVIAPGVYFGTAYINVEQIVLRSTDPTSPAVVRSTIIDAAGDGAVVQIDGRANDDCVVSGLTLRNGHAFEGGSRASSLYGGGISGAPWDSSTEPAHIQVTHNIIEMNFADHGGGIFGCVGVIENNLIRHNRSRWDGGGLYECRGTIRGNTVSENVAGRFGGGLADCLEAIHNNQITGNRASSGGGLSSCNGQIRNNTIAYNTAHDSIGAMRLCTGRIENCIVWGNTSTANAGEFSECSTPTYSCIQGWTGGGEGNISDDPLFTTGPLGTFYLSQVGAGQAAQSPCVDAGSATALSAGLAGLTTRTDGAADEGRVDMGYHYLPVIPDLPNLVIEGFDFAPFEADLAGGTPVFFAGAVRNVGSQATAGRFWVEFRVRPEEMTEGDGVYLCDSMLVEDSLGVGEGVSLMGRAGRTGQTSRTSQTYWTYALPEGIYTVGVKVDPLDEIAEQREEDNVVWLGHRRLYVGVARSGARGWERYR